MLRASQASNNPTHRQPCILSQLKELLNSNLGYYSAVPSTAKEYMAAYEWDYWMLGKPATQDIMAPDGKKLAGAGEVRDGGSFEKRMGGVACWNATMDENRYMVRKWNEFVAA